MEITISLTIFERNFLSMLADRGSRVDMNMNSFGDGVKRALEGLDRKGAISMTPLLDNPGMIEFRLTSIGMNLVDLIREKNVNV